MPGKPQQVEHIQLFSEEESLILSWERVPGSWVKFSIPALRCTWCPLQGAERPFGIAVTSLSVPGAGARLLQSCGSAPLVVLLLKTALSVWVTPQVLTVTGELFSSVRMQWGK